MRNNCPPRGLLTRALMEKHGYGRRKEELADAKQAILRRPETDSP